MLLAGSTPKEAAMGLNQRAQAAADAGKLGTIKDVIMECLHEDPQMRPTAQSIVPVRYKSLQFACLSLEVTFATFRLQHMPSCTRARTGKQKF